MKKPPTWLALIPVLAALWVWLSPLAFVPVPWPDDSAFYFVAREFFKWPPRWVMLTQAAFEPSYAIFNFNTMPLYPILIGLGRLIGIDGSFALKFWPLSAWAMSGAWLTAYLARRGLPWGFGLLIAGLFAFDPSLRWASVLVRPESLIGLCGVLMTAGLCFGFSDRWRVRGLWDPVAACLAMGALAHFNAVHLIYPVIAAYLLAPRRLFAIGWKTCLYLSPWLVLVVVRLPLFIHQMTLQWTRLAVGNSWLNSVSEAVGGVNQEMGAPLNVSPAIQISNIGLWVVILTAVSVIAMSAVGFVVKARKEGVPIREYFSKTVHSGSDSHAPTPLPAAVWLLSACWLWNTKPEVWFTYYIHITAWTFCGIALTVLWNRKKTETKRLAYALAALLILVVSVDAYCDVDQMLRLAQDPTWQWSTHKDFIDCIDQRLTALENELDHPKPFRVWDPTFPDITIELSRRHPDWEFTRTDDFYERWDRAVQFGHEVEAVVVPETISPGLANITAPASEYPGVQSVWMNWNGYYLIRLMKDPAWNPNRFICQRGRWQAFFFMKSPRS